MYTRRKNTDVGIYLTCANPDCPRQNGIFLVSYIRRDQQQYCSRECSIAVMNPRVRKQPNTKIGIWLTCKNPDCHLLDRLFLVSYNERDRQYCSTNCNLMVLHQKPKKRNTKINVWLICENPDCSLPDKAFLAKRKKRNIQKYCSKTCSNRVITNNRLQDPNRKTKRYNIWLTCANPNCTLPDRMFLVEYPSRFQKSCSRHCSSVAIAQDPDTKIKRQKSVVSFWNNTENRERMAESHRTPEARAKYGYHASLRLKERWKDPEYVDKMAKSASSSMKKNHKSKAFGKAQKFLFDELNSRMPGIFGWEKRIILNELIRDKYNCNHKYYLLDIPVIKDGKIIHNFEVDGPMGHSFPDEIERDTIRDLINLNENKFATTRFTNEEIFTDVKKVADKAINIIKPLINKGV